MEQIKEAFYKVKQDIECLKKEVFLLNKGLVETRQSLVEICEVLKNISRKNEEKRREETEKQVRATPTLPTQKQTDITINPTDNLPQNPLKVKNLDISTGNEGVPTDRQTNQQTNQQTDKGSYNNNFFKQQNKTTSIDNAAQILESLDNLKKEIRLKFKRLTEQEFLVFSTIYQSSEETGYTDYKNLSERLNLTESSIRDYIGRLIKKGIPVEKIKVNNKMIRLSISQNLKKIASLPTILQLRAI
jgi:DNA-binding MarR family transcriptional regulator